MPGTYTPPAAYNGHKFASGFMGAVLIVGGTTNPFTAYAAGVYTFTPPTITPGAPPTVSPSPSGASVAELPLVDWSNTGGDAEIVRIVNSVSGRSPIKDATTVDEKDIKIAVDYDFAVNQGAFKLVGATSGSHILNVFLFLNQTVRSGLDGQYWYFTDLILKQTPMKVEVKGAVALSINAEASGPFFPPGITTST